MNKMIPSELIHADKNGNAVIGKNVEVKGTTKLNGGFKPIHSYVLTDTNGHDYPFEVYVEVETDTNWFSFFGNFSNSICLGFYAINNGTITDLRTLYFEDITNPYVFRGDNHTGESSVSNEVATM